MKIIDKGFTTIYNVEKISVITPKRSFEMEGKKYPASIELRASNLIENDDAELGAVVTEQILIIKFDAKEEKLRELNTFFTLLQRQSKVIRIKGELARVGSKGVYTAKSVLTASEFMKAFQEPKQELKK